MLIAAGSQSQGVGDAKQPGPLSARCALALPRPGQALLSVTKVHIWGKTCKDKGTLDVNRPEEGRAA